MYICGTGIISPQQSFGQHQFLSAMVTHQGERMTCIEPDYKDLLDPKLIRRMSRIIKFGTASAMECLKDAGWETTDAIITGTAYGCLEDTGVFLARMVEFKEQMLTPTAFIQSTHNTIGAQIGLSLKSHSYNNTFVHRAFSFEHALVDAQMLFHEKQAEGILVGAADEITGYSHSILRRFGIYRAEAQNTSLMEVAGKGTMAGEGAAFFALQQAPAGNAYAKILGIQTFQCKGAENVEPIISAFLTRYAVPETALSFVLTGVNGDLSHDAHFASLAAGIFNGIPTSGYKQFCGEYPTSSAFALWLAAKMCKEGKLPEAMGSTMLSKPEQVLIYNVDLLGHHALILVSSC